MTLEIGGGDESGFDHGKEVHHEKDVEDCSGVTYFAGVIEGSWPYKLGRDDSCDDKENCECDYFRGCCCY